MQDATGQHGSSGWGCPVLLAACLCVFTYLSAFQFCSLNKENNVSPNKIIGGLDKCEESPSHTVDA